MNELSFGRTFADEDKQALRDAIFEHLQSLGPVVSNDHYSRNGNLVKTPESTLDKDELDLRWLELSEYLKEAFRLKFSKLEWAQIIDKAKDHNYEPQRFRTHIARVLKSVESIVNGRQPELTGRQAGVGTLELDDAPVRRELMVILNGEGSNKSLTRKRKEYLKKLSESGRSGLDMVKILHSGTHAEVDTLESDRLIGRLITDVYKSATAEAQVAIVDFIKNQFKAKNLRGPIKDVLVAFNIDGYHPFTYIESGMREATTLKMIEEVKDGRVRRLQKPAGKRRGR